MMVGKLYRLLLAPALVLTLASCDLGPTELRMHVLNQHQVNSESLREIFSARGSIRLVAADASTRESPMEVLLSDRADIALVNNSTAFIPGVRAILPVYESVLHLLVRKDDNPANNRFALEGAKVFIANRSMAGAKFVNFVGRRQGLAADDYTLLDESDAEQADFIVFFGPIEPEELDWYREGYELVSLESPRPGGQQVSADGVGYLLPKMHARTIPAHTYNVPGNRFPVQTIAVPTLLVTHKNIPERAIYEFTRILLEEKPRFTAIAPGIFGGINEKFDPLSLSFPLHPGARRYLERDEPSLLERYAETINMLVYLAFLALTGLFALARWRAHRKKDRIDTFYTRALGIREQFDGNNGPELREQLRELENEAFHSLIGEKLAADESFRIFIDLLHRTDAELRQGNPP